MLQVREKKYPDRMSGDRKSGKESIENIILRHSSRGMPMIREYLPEHYCAEAAREILNWRRGVVLLTTGFYVAGFAETDGPLGTLMLSKALEKLGFSPVIVTDRYCEGYFESEGIRTEYMPVDAGDEAADVLLRKYCPAGLISVERCGRDKNGVYANMRGVDISSSTAPCDALFIRGSGKFPLIGVGDGGNEIGMGDVADPVREKLSLTPSEVKVDYLVIATVSNWGAYGIIAELEEMSGLPLLPDYCEAEDYLRKTVAIGSVDGISHEHTARVDGFGLETEKEILDALHRQVQDDMALSRA